MSHFKNKVFRTTITEDKIGANVRSYTGLNEVSGLGAGDSFYLPGFIGNSEAESIFRDLVREIDFVPMFNLSSACDDAWPIPRLVSAQTFKSDSSTPIYRMPGCNQANIATTHWTDSVRDVCDRAGQVIDAELNHCVCTLFRDEHDSLGFHKDKMLDLADQSLILSISFGAARPIQIYEIDGPARHVVVLQPGSLLAIGPQTNERFEHGIPKLKVPTGPRISLSVRSCCSFIEGESQAIVGKGESHQTRNYPFIQSRDDDSRYSPEVKEQVAKWTNEAEQQMAELRATLS